MATKTRRRPAPKRPVQAPKKRTEPSRFPRWLPWLVTGLLVAGAAAGAFLLAKEQAQSGSEGPAAATGGLPDTPDYHSLLVAPGDPGHILLGTHAGLYESTNGGRAWTRVALEGQDAMNLAASEAKTVWAAGHNVLARSTDGGETWEDVVPDGLPGLDVHGFAVDPRDRKTLWAAIAGQGLYRSTDGGESFSLVSREVGPGVMALAVTRDGRVLAGDMQQGLFVSGDDGKSWKVTLPAALMGLAVNPDEPERVLATGQGILLSRDGGRNWEEVLPLGQGAGPVAWAPSDPRTAYVVGFDKTLYKTTDGGETWNAVA